MHFTHGAKQWPAWAAASDADRVATRAVREARAVEPLLATVGGISPEGFERAAA